MAQVDPEPASKRQRRAPLHLRTDYVVEGTDTAGSVDQQPNIGGQKNARSARPRQRPIDNSQNSDLDSDSGAASDGADPEEEGGVTEDGEGDSDNEGGGPSRAAVPRADR